jgi:hypothetical protein
MRLFFICLVVCAVSVRLARFYHKTTTRKELASETSVCCGFRLIVIVYSEVFSALQVAFGAAAADQALLQQHTHRHNAGLIGI